MFTVYLWIYHGSRIANVIVVTYNMVYCLKMIMFVANELVRDETEKGV